MKNFWSRLPRPFFALAPLEDVTDAAFRRLIAQKGKPDVMFTEFTSADGLVLARGNGQAKLEKKLLYSESERPIAAQIFSSNPDHIHDTAMMVAALGFDGIDINMGCPDRAVEKSGCGAALIKNPQKARELIRAAARSGLPVSVKTRIGYGKDELEEWLPELLSENLAAITIHARTRKEMSTVPAHWDSIGRAVTIRDSLGSKTLIVGNGDVKNIEDAREKARESGCDGVMMGRAIFGNLFLFANSNELTNSRETKISALTEHLELFDELLGGTTHYATMKKHFKTYISGWSGAKGLRAKLMATHDVREAREVLARGREVYTI